MGSHTSTSSGVTLVGNGLAFGTSALNGGTSGGSHGSVTGALAKGTTSLGRRSGTAGGGLSGRTSGTEGHGLKPIFGEPEGPATVFERFINRIPSWVWILVGGLVALAALAGGAALLSERRARNRGREIAAVAAVAVTDSLTGVLNRRGFTEAAQRELERARRYDHPLALAYVDVRGLKAVNDSEGHLAGDKLLREVAGLLNESGRSYDVIGRIGGDELAVVLPEVSGEGAAAMTERVRSRLPAHRRTLGFGVNWDVTIGTAAYPEDGDTLDELLAMADRRLYEQRGIELR